MSEHVPGRIDGRRAWEHRFLDAHVDRVRFPDGSEGEQVHVEANNDAILLVLSGEPIDEPVVGYGPFVMNSEQEVQQAIADYNSDRFGQLAS